MKKKFEAELISIAHRILKLKNKSELIQLHQETQKLYEKLSVLRFVEENFGDVKPTIGLAEIREKLEVAFDKEEEVEVMKAEAVQPEVKIEAENIEEEEPVSQKEKETVAVNSEEIKEETPELADETPENLPEQIEDEEVEEEVLPETKQEKMFEPLFKEEDAFKPAFELSFEPNAEAAKEEIILNPSQISFEDILRSSYSDPIFVKPGELIEKEEEQKVPQAEREFLSATKLIHNYKTDIDTRVTLNDRLSKGVTIGLNDRMAFIKQLFGGSTEDYNRVLSQLITYDTLEEAHDFIDDMVKPDYHNWEGKDEYAQRFMEIIEKKFS